MKVHQSVIELETFQKRANAIMADDERAELVSFIAASPEAGVSSGGRLRKVRIPRAGGDKSGGYPTPYVFGGRAIPITLVTVFAKNEKDNLTKAERAAAVELGERLIAAYGGNNK